MDFPCGGGRGLRSNICSLFPTVGANCYCWRDQVGEVGARFCVDFLFEFVGEWNSE